MRIAFATTQGILGSTIIGRVKPLAEKLTANHDLHVLVLGLDKSSLKDGAVKYHNVGREPFTRSDHGKQRLKGIALISNMLSTALRTALILRKIKPDLVVIEKTLPANVLGVWLWSWCAKKGRIILDVDDFELTANKLSSLAQRTSIHWAERTATKLSHSIITASPFLSDHFKQLAQQKKPIYLIPTGLSEPKNKAFTASAMPTISYIGSVSISSGHRVDLLPEILLKLRKEVSTVKMKIAGSGDDVEKLKHQFKQLDLIDAVEWTGRFDSAQLSDILANTSVIIDPIDDSVAQRAKSSYRVALAALVGLPIVTSNIGVRPMLLPEELHARVFARPANVSDYVEKIKWWLENPITLERRSMLKKHAEEYTWEKLAIKYEHIISS